MRIMTGLGMCITVDLGTHIMAATIGDIMADIIGVDIMVETIEADIMVETIEADIMVETMEADTMVETMEADTMAEEIMGVDIGDRGV